VLGAQAYNPKYLEDWDREDCFRGQTKQGVLEIPCPKLSDQNKLEFDSSNSAFALQVQSSEFKPQSYQRKRDLKSVLKIRKIKKPKNPLYWQFLSFVCLTL
jgi:hypothetical protein